MENTFDKEALQKQYGPKRMASLLSGLLALLVAGLIFAWSIFTTPIANDTGWSTQTLSMNFRVVMICYSIGCLASSIIQRKQNGEPRMPLLIGAACALVGFACLNIFSGIGIASVFIFYGAIAAFGIGIVFNAIFTTNNLWFPDHVGLVTGLQMFAFGIASLIFGVQIDALMVAIGWRTVLTGLGVLAFILSAIAAFLMSAPPAEIDQIFPGKASASNDDIAERAAKNPHFLTDFGVSKTSFTIGDMFKSKVFWVGLVWFICIGCLGVTLLGESRQDALSLNADVTMATLIVGMISLFSGGASVIYGILLDNFGLVNHFRLVTIFAFIGGCLITVAFVIQNPVVFFAGALTVAVSYGGLPIFSATFTLNRYGRDYYSANCAVGTMLLVPASLASMILAPTFMSFNGLMSMYAGFVGVVMVGIVFVVLLIRMYRSDMSKLV